MQSTGFGENHRSDFRVHLALRRIGEAGEGFDVEFGWFQ